MPSPDSFRMPPLPAVWRDASGREHAFGGAWGTEAPPEDAYSRVTHPERYAPLHDVADALVAHLVEAHGCAVEADAAGDGEVRAVRLRSAADAAGDGIRIAWTDFPGVTADLGGEVVEAAPVCGCDACDEPLEDAARQWCDRVRAAVGSAAEPAGG